MADRKVTALTELTAPVASDVFPVIDVSEASAADKNKKIQLTTILKNIPDGTVSSPSVGFTSDSGFTGFFRAGSNDLGVSANQALVASFSSTGLKLGTGTPAAQLHLFSTDTTDQVIIENSDTGADNAPDLVLYRNSSSPAADDNLGNLLFRANDAAGNTHDYAAVVAQIEDTTNTSEDGVLDIMTSAAGTLASRIRLKNTNVGINEASPQNILHVTDTQAGVVLEVQCTANDAASGGDILLSRIRGASGAGQDNDLLSTIFFEGKNDATTPQEVNYAAIQAKIIDASDETEDGQLNLQVEIAGTLTTVLTVDSTGATVVGNVVVSGTVDGVDIATRDTLFGGLTSSSGVLTNGVTATTQSASDNSTKVATTAYTDTAISNLVDSSPSALNTLNELAAALGDDANFSTTVTNSIATKMPLAGGTFTGDVTFTGDSANIVFDKSDNALEFADDVKATFGGDLEVYHNANGSFISHEPTSAKLFIQTNSTAGIEINKGTSENLAKFIPDGPVELFHNNVKVFETTATGTNTNGSHVDLGATHFGDVLFYADNYNIFFDKSESSIVFSDNAKANFGSAADLSILHNGTDSKITNITGNLLIEAKASQTAIKVIPDGNVELSHSGTTKLNTSSSGITVTGSVTTQDMNMSNLNGTANEVDSTKGSWSIQEGADDLFIINRVSGKKYKFNLTEIS